MNGTIEKDPKLIAGVERLRNGTSSLTSESKTQGLTYASLQGALKRMLGADGYVTLMRANHKAKPKGTKPKVTKPKAAKRAAKKSTGTAKAKKESEREKP